MVNFWRWMARANARAVFFCLLAGLLIVTAWWIYKEHAPTQVPTYVPAAPVKDQSLVDLGVLAFINEQLAIAGKYVRRDPYFHEFEPRRISEVSAPGPLVEVVDAPVEPPRLSPPPPPSGPKMVTLLYHGMVVRPDGKTVAILENKDTGRSFSLTNGAVVGAYQVQNIAMKEIELSRSDGTPVILNLGSPQAIPESSQ